MARTKQQNRGLAQQIGLAIRTYRLANNMTQVELAEIVDLESETISRIENGKRLPTVEKLVDMANALRIPVASFFEAVDSSATQVETDRYAQMISAAIHDLPDTGKNFVLKVAQDYARYHVTTKKLRSAK
jgi:transcriptional regulator with XRE-family HTH domain